MFKHNALHKILSLALANYAIALLRSYVGDCLQIRTPTWIDAEFRFAIITLKDEAVEQHGFSDGRRWPNPAIRVHTAIR